MNAVAFDASTANKTEAQVPMVSRLPQVSPPNVLGIEKLVNFPTLSRHIY